MAKKRLIGGIDVGTTKVCAAIARLDEKTIELLGVGTVRSRGLRKGVVVNLTETISAIREAISLAEKEAQTEVSSAYVAVGGPYLLGLNSSGETEVRGKNSEIAAEDIHRAIEAAKDTELPQNHQIIHVLTQDYRVDQEEGIENPLGIFGQNLRVNVHIIVNSNAAVQNTVNAVNKAGLVVDAVVAQQLASSESVLSDDEKEMGALVVDIGGGTTDIAVYHHGSICHSEVLPIGSNLITKDIAIGLKAPVNEAEQLKIQAGCVFPESVPQEEAIEIFEVGTGHCRTMPRQHLCEIVRARCDEILVEVEKAASKAGINKQLISGTVFTGGGAMLDGLTARAEEVLGMPVRLGYPVNIVGPEHSAFQPAFSTALGLLRYAQRFQDEAVLNVARKAASRQGQFSERLRSWFLEKIG